MRLVEVYTRDLKRADAFYQDVLGPEPDFESPYSKVADAVAEREQLIGAGVEVTEIRAPAPGLRVLDARDPDRNRFSIESRESG